MKGICYLLFIADYMMKVVVDKKQLTLSIHKSYKTREKCQKAKICYKDYITYRFYYQSERFLKMNIANLKS